MLVLSEHGGRFAVRDLDGGGTVRSGARSPDAPDRWLRPTAPGRHGVLYQAEEAGAGSVRRLRVDGRHELVAGGPASFDGLVADGVHAAWTRSSGPDGKGGFAQVELWTAPLPGDVGPAVRLARLPAGPPPLLSIGSGWIAARFDVRDVRLWRIADGEGAPRRLPTPDRVEWDGGPHGLVIAAGQVWVKASSPDRPGNDVRQLVRFDLDRLGP